MTIGQAAEVSVPLLDLQAQYRPIRDDILGAIADRFSLLQRAVGEALL